MVRAGTLHSEADTRSRVLYPLECRDPLLLVTLFFLFETCSEVDVAPTEQSPFRFLRATAAALLWRLAPRRRSWRTSRSMTSRRRWRRPSTLSSLTCPTTRSRPLLPCLVVPRRVAESRSVTTPSVRRRLAQSSICASCSSRCRVPRTVVLTRDPTATVWTQSPSPTASLRQAVRVTLSCTMRRSMTTSSRRRPSTMPSSCASTRASSRRARPRAPRPASTTS